MRYEVKQTNEVGLELEALCIDTAPEATLLPIEPRFRSCFVR